MLFRSIYENERRFDLVVRMEQSARQDINNVRQLLISTPSGLQVPMEQLAQVDGVMVGRWAYHDPWALQSWDELFWGGNDRPSLSRQEVEEAMVDYMEQQGAANGTPWPRMARHMLGLWNGTPGAKRWRRVWSDHTLKDQPVRQVWHRAGQERVAREVAAPRGVALAHSL